MRIAKLFAYFILAILLPLWLFFLSKTDLNNEEKLKKNFTEKEKKIDEQKNLEEIKWQTLIKQLEISNDNQSKLIEILILRSEKLPTKPLNETLDSSLKQLADISIANASTIKEQIKQSRNIELKIPPVEIIQSLKKSPEIQDSVPIYDLKEKGPFIVEQIFLKGTDSNEVYSLIINNTSQTKTAFIEKDLNDTTKIKFNLNYIHNGIPPSTHGIIPFYFKVNSKQMLYLNGYFINKNDKKRDKKITFKIPLIINRTDYQ